MEKVRLFLLLFGLIFLLITCVFKPENQKVSITNFEQECINVVDSVIAAINRRDMDGFLDLLNDSVKFYVYKNKFRGVGKERMKELFYTTIVETPRINTKVINRMVLNNKVVDRQVVQSFAFSQEMHSICIYIIENGKVDEFNYFYY